MKTKIKKANKQLKKIITWFKKNEDKFSYTNLKMYEAAFYDYRKDFPLTAEAMDDPEYSLFYSWCDDISEQFEEWIKEEGLDYNPDYIWHTSSFKVHKDVVIDNRYGRHYGIDIVATIKNLFSYDIYGNDVIALMDNGLIDEEYIDTLLNDDKIYYVQDIKDDLDYIATDFFDDIKKHFEDALKVRDYIDDTKEHQVEYFKEWLSFYEEIRKYGLEQEYKEDQKEYISRLAWLRTFSYDKESVLSETRLSSETLQKLALAH